MGPRYCKSTRYSNLGTEKSADTRNHGETDPDFGRQRMANPHRHSWALPHSSISGRFARPVAQSCRLLRKHREGLQVPSYQAGVKVTAWRGPDRAGRTSAMSIARVAEALIERLRRQGDVRGVHCARPDARGSTWPSHRLMVKSTAALIHAREVRLSLGHIPRSSALALVERRPSPP